MDNKFDLTNGGITSNLLKASIPLIIAMIVETGYNIVDMIFVGRIGPEAIAGVTLAFPVVFFMISIGAGVGTGATALIARSVGGKRFKDADNIAEHSLLMSIIIAIVLTLLGWVTMVPLFKLLGAEGLVLTMVVDYVSVIYLGSIFLFAGTIGGAILRGVGDMKTQMTAMVTGAVLNAILDAVLIFGFGMGIKGAAYATIISRFIASAYMFQYLFRHKTVINFSLADFKLKVGMFWQILRIGLPSTISQMSMAIGWATLARIASSFGPLAIAALGIGFRVDTMVIFPVFGIGIALITIVGQNLGAGKPERAKESTLTAIGINTSALMFAGAMFYLFAKQIVMIFTTDPELIALSVTYVRTMSPTYFFIALGITIGSAILGTGNAVPHMVLSLIRVLVLSVPLAYLFSIILGYGIIGIWWGMALAIVASGFASLIWFHYINWDSSHSFQKS